MEKDQTKDQAKQKRANPYDIDDAKRQALCDAVKGIKPERKKTLVALVESIRAEINAARDNGASWEEIATAFNDKLGTHSSGNSLSQVYASIKKRTAESRKGNKPSYEELEAEIAKLRKELADKKQGKK